MESKSTARDSGEETKVCGLAHDELTRAISTSPGAADAWQALPASHQREYLRWIEEAKTAETREKRVVKTIERFLAKSKRD